MKNFMRNFTKRFKSDRADSLVTAVLVVPLMISIIFTGVDFGFFLNNQSAVSNAARDGARTIAILGGNDSNTISEKYGNNTLTASECIFNGITLSTTECQIYKTLDTGKLVQLDIHSIECSPGATQYVGEDVNCEVVWNYRGLGLSAINLVSLAQKDDPNGEGLGFKVTTKGTAKAETSIQPT